MSKLTNVQVQKISLVKAGANGEPITIYKSAEVPVEPEAKTEPEVKTEPAAQTQPEAVTEPAATPEAPVVKSAEPDMSTIGKFLNVMKGFFVGEEKPIAKSTDIPCTIDWNSFESQINNPRWNVQDAVYTLADCLSNIFWDETITDGKSLILKNIDDFKAYVEGILNRPVEVQKSVFKKVEKEDDDMKVEEVKALLEPISKSITDMTAKITAIESSVKPAEEPKPEGEVAKSAEVKPEEKPVEKSEDAEIKTMLQDIAKSVEGLGTRVAELETTRGLSNGQEAQQVAKSADEWDGVLPGLTL